MARIYEPIPEKVQTKITNKLLSKNVKEIRADFYKGKQYDTILGLQGWVPVAGDTINEFIDELNTLIEKYKI